jgi:hypothetical protein
MRQHSLLVVALLVFPLLQGCFTERASTLEKIGGTAMFASFITGAALTIGAKYQHPERNKNLCLTFGCAFDATSIIIAAFGGMVGRRHEDE